MSRKKKKRRKRSVPYYSQRDYHHYFYIRAIWNKKYAANELRNHPYCGAYILKYSEHPAIHDAVHCVPMPSEDECRYVINCLNEMYYQGKISDKDNPVKRFNILIGLLGDCPTSEALKLQRDALLKFKRR